MGCGALSEPAMRSTGFTYYHRSGFISGPAGEQLGFHPPANPYSIGNPGIFADKIEQDDHHGTTLDDGLHHEATTGFADVARLLDDDVPGRVVHEGIGIVELQHFATHPDLITRVGRVFS